MNKTTFTLESLFRNPPLPPNTYQLHAPDHIETTEDLFHFVYRIYKEGCIMLFGKNGTFRISELTYQRQFLMKQYMRSCGVLPRIWVYSKQDVHDVYEQFQQQVLDEKIRIQLSLQRKGRFITGVRIQLPVSNDDKTSLVQLRDLIKKQNDYINLMNISIGTNNLSLYKVSICVSGVLYVLRFFWE